MVIEMPPRAVIVNGVGYIAPVDQKPGAAVKARAEPDIIIGESPPVTVVVVQGIAVIVSVVKAATGDEH